MEAWGPRSLIAGLVRTPVILGVALALGPAASAPAALTPVGEFGGLRPGELIAPAGVARDGGGNTYVLDAFVPAVQRYDPSGAPATRWGPLGDGPGEFENPTALGANPSTGESYAADFGGDPLTVRIQRFDSDGAFLGQFGSLGTAEGQFASLVLGIAVNQGTGDVYVAERSRVSRFSADGQFELMWGKDVVPGGGTGPETCAAGCKQGEEGVAEGELDGVAGIATAGNVVFVTESDNARVQRFNATTGAFELMGGRDVDPAGGVGAETCIAGCKRGMAGNGPGELNDPAGIDVDPGTNRLWIADSDNERVQRWSSATMAYQAEFGSAGTGDAQFRRPFGLTEGGGTVAVTDLTLNRVQTFDSATGAFESSFGTPGPATVVFPRGVGAGPGGVYVADNLSRAVRFGGAGALLGQFGGPGIAPGQFGIPGGVGVGADGTVYVVDSTGLQVERFDAAGNFLSEWGSAGAGPGQFNSPSDVAVGPDATVYVADGGGDRIQRFDPAGTYLSEWGTTGDGPGEFFGPSGVAVGRDGSVYVADLGNSRVQRFTADGTFLASWGTSGGGDGQFDSPGDVAVDGGGNVYVSDTGNNRVQRFEPDGAFRERLGANGGDGSFGDGPGEFHEPFSLTVDPLGYVYVADTFNNRIQRLAASPELALSGKRRQRFKRPKVDVECPTGPCAVALTGKVRTKVPRHGGAAKARGPKLKLKRIELALASGDVQRAKLKFRRAKRSRRILKQLLRDGGRAKLTVRGVATNEAGAARATRKLKLKRR